MISFYIWRTDNVGCLAFHLTPAEMERLDAASAVPVPYPWEMVFRFQAGRKHVATRK